MENSIGSVASEILKDKPKNINKFIIALFVDLYLKKQKQVNEKNILTVLINNLALKWIDIVKAGTQIYMK